MHARHLLLVMYLTLAGVAGENVLIWPTEGSHWINLKYIIAGLMARGHDVTVATMSQWFVNNSESSAMKLEVFQVPFTHETTEAFLNNWLDVSLYQAPDLSFWGRYRVFSALMAKGRELGMQVCDGILKNEELVQRLREAKFKVLLSDPVQVCGDLLALKLGVPLVFTLRFSRALLILSELSDKMSFVERSQNVLYSFMYDWVFLRSWGDWDAYYSEASVHLVPQKAQCPVS
ncbi:UDP-glucuronosyltransferase 2A2-like [Leucoraja erinacea]|uniref:UDP-glucuronosyltransferase 2A2-like n=1 Tax=Leucoraja erinaceus TaxID=7782 RepID=UPI0024559E9A|nr:UDP-glucuronosyltransferase 2A2-like [Leucoraja erinacea]